MGDRKTKKQATDGKEFFTHFLSPRTYRLAFKLILFPNAF
jgi:hypothetical protein